MNLLGASSSRLCLRTLSARAASRHCSCRIPNTFHTTIRSFSAASPLLANPSSPKPPKRPGLLERVKWYKEDGPSTGGSSGAAPRRPVIRDILTMYEELPPTYRDRDGLPFAKKDLTPAEVSRIFGAKLKPEFANTLLRILHGRRVAGTLDDPAYKANTARFTKQQQDTALKYLREKLPVDETMNSGLRAQDELEQLERELAETSKAPATPPPAGSNASQAAATTTAADPDAKVSLPEEKSEELKVEYKPDPVYGYSALDAIRAENQARIKAEEKRIEQDKLSQGEPVAGTLEAYVERGAVSPRMQKWMEEGSSGIEDAPELTTWDRLAPSIAFAALVVGSCIGFAVIYNPPEPGDRLFPEISPAAATVATLIGLNVAVWGLWKVPPLWRFLNSYFMLVVGMPKPVSILTSMFSHQKLGHMALNMAVLYYIGNRLHDEVGRANFLGIYLSSGAIGYVSSLCFHAANVASLGASGAVLGITAAYFWLHMWDKFRIMGFPAEPSEGVDGVAFLVSVVIWNLAAAFAPSKVAQADIISHMGGLLSGIGLVHVLQTVLNTIPGGDDGSEGERNHNSSSSGSSGGGDGLGRDGSDAGTRSGRTSVVPDAGCEVPNPAQQHAPGPERRNKTFDLWGTNHEKS